MSDISADIVTSTGFHLKWSGNATRYTVCAGRIRESTESTDFTFVGMNPGVSYLASVTPYNEYDVQGQPHTVTVQTTAHPPPVPVITIDNRHSTFFTVTWTTNPSALYYIVNVDGISHLVLTG
jgi:hypothetical protein